MPDLYTLNCRLARLHREANGGPLPAEYYDTLAAIRSMSGRA